MEAGRKAKKHVRFWETCARGEQRNSSYKNRLVKKLAVLAHATLFFLFVRRSVPYLKDLPLQDLTTKHDVCIFHYFRYRLQSFLVLILNNCDRWPRHLIFISKEVISFCPLFPRRGVVIVKESKTKWIYVVKSVRIVKLDWLFFSEVRFTSTFILWR